MKICKHVYVVVSDRDLGVGSWDNDSMYEGGRVA